LLFAAAGAGQEFTQKLMHPWKITTCPMSSAHFSERNSGVAAAWETDGQVYWATYRGGKLSEPLSPGGPSKKKYPVVQKNSKGWTLLAWVEGAGWQKAGELRWQLYNPELTPVGEVKKAGTVPVWSFAAVASRGEDFEIIY